MFGGYADSNTAWRQFVIDVPNGMHTYTLTEHAEVDLAGPGFVLDTFVCSTP